MKKVLLTTEVSVNNFSMLQGKSFGFIRGVYEDIFVPPPICKELQFKLQFKKENKWFVTTKQTDKGISAEVVVSSPQYKSVLEKSDIELVRKYAEAGILFENTFSDAYKIWSVMPSSDSMQFNKINQKAKSKKKWAGTQQEVIEKIKAEAQRIYEDDPYGQATLEMLMVSVAKRAQEYATCYLLDFINEMQAAVDRLTAECDAREAVYEAEIDRQMAANSGEIEKIKKLLVDDRYKGVLSIKMRHDFLGVIKKSKEMNVSIEEFLDHQVDLVKARERDSSGDVDTFGYCHGEDFEGGSW